MLNDNTITSSDGAQVYINRIFEYFDLYLDELCDDPEEARRYVQRPMVFRGALKYIYSHVFKPGISNPYLCPEHVKYKQNSILDYSDVDTLSDIWECYTFLCGKYNQTPTIGNYGLLTGIEYATLNNWKNGNINNNIVNTMVKEWDSESERALVDNVINGNQGASFILRSKYSYTEAPSVVNVVPGISTGLTDREIEQLAGGKDATLRDVYISTHPEE